MPEHLYKFLSADLLVQICVHLLHYALKLLLVCIAEQLSEFIDVQEAGVILNRW